MSPKIRILTSDGVYFTVPKDIVCLSPTLVTLLEDSEDEQEAIALPTINSDVLKLVVDWLTHHKNDPKVTSPVESSYLKASKPFNLNNDNVDSWDIKFLDDQDTGTLLELVLAANQLEIKFLLEITSNRVKQTSGV